MMVKADDSEDEEKPDEEKQLHEAASTGLNVCFFTEFHQPLERSKVRLGDGSFIA